MLPLYLGSSEAHMTKGATVVLGSSAPLGEVPSNCVIAAHRGYGDAPMFRDIEKLSVGDEVSVCTVWESYSYTVTSTKVIAPSDSAAVGVQPGKDLVTLITCHPYGSNAYRYVVECERSDIVTGTVDGAEVYQSNTESHEKGISLPEVEDYVRILGGVVLVLCALVLVVRAVKNRRNRCAGAKHRRK